MRTPRLFRCLHPSRNVWPWRVALLTAVLLALMACAFYQAYRWLTAFGL